MSVEYMCDLEKRHKRELAATMQVRIYSYQDQNAKGIITFLLNKKEVMFSGLDQMCLIIEDFLDRESVFEEVFEENSKPHSIDSGDVCGSWSNHTMMMRMRGCPQKFAIRVYGRQNMSLQGEIKAGEKRCYFRSGMELMRLMHEWLPNRHEAPGERNGASHSPQRICNI